MVEWVSDTESRPPPERVLRERADVGVYPADAFWECGNTYMLPCFLACLFGWWAGGRLYLHPIPSRLGFSRAGLICHVSPNSHSSAELPRFAVPTPLFGWRGWVTWRDGCQHSPSVRGIESPTDHLPTSSCQVSPRLTPPPTVPPPTSSTADMHHGTPLPSSSLARGPPTHYPPPVQRLPRL